MELADDFPCVGAAARQAAVSASLTCTAGTGAARSPLPHRAARCWCQSPALPTPAHLLPCVVPTAAGQVPRALPPTEGITPVPRAVPPPGLRAPRGAGQAHARPAARPLPRGIMHPTGAKRAMDICPSAPLRRAAQGLPKLSHAARLAQITTAATAGPTGCARGRQLTAPSPAGPAPGRAQKRHSS